MSKLSFFSQNCFLSMEFTRYCKRRTLASKKQNSHSSSKLWTNTLTEWKKKEKYSSIVNRKGANFLQREWASSWCLISLHQNHEPRLGEDYPFLATLLIPHCQMIIDWEVCQTLLITNNVESNWTLGTSVALKSLNFCGFICKKLS